MEEYIPSYPRIESESFARDIVDKYEFQLSAYANSVEDISDDSDLFFDYQNNVARFLSAKTMYDSLLLIHEMGTGKSGSAIATAHLVRTQNPAFQKVIVLANGKTQLNNFRNEIFYRLPFLMDRYQDTKDRRVILRREGYFFETYRTFSKSIEKKPLDQIRRQYENSIIIMDEIHNLTSSTGSSTRAKKEEGGGTSASFTNVRTYNILYEFVHQLRNRKLLCLTGTPIRDKPQEIAKVLNLIIPRSQKLPIGDDFKNTYLQPVKQVKVLGDIELTLYRFKDSMKRDFQERIKGYVSYLKKSVPSNIRIVYEVNSSYDATSRALLEKFRVYANIMTDPQNEIYLEDFIEDIEFTGKGEEDEEEEEEEDVEESSSPAKKTPSLAYAKSRQSAIFAFPEKDVEYVVPLYEKTKETASTTTKKSKYMRSLGWTKSMRKLFPKDLSLESKLERISQYSTIYAKILREIIFHPSELTYIYSFLKSGSGVYVLASFLVEYFQFEIVRKVSDVRTKSTTKRRLLLLNHDFLSDNDLRDMIDAFNKDDNALGEYIQVVIGTKQTKEGITLKNIRQIHIVQPDWNYADISQAIGRGIRVNSHMALLHRIQNVNVRIFQHVSLPIVEDDVNPEYSIDLEQYRRSEIKDMNIKMIERVLLESSWDCYLNRQRNTGVVESSRECEYTKCAYVCDGIPNNYQPSSSYDTFNPYYSKIARRILSSKLKDEFQNRPVVSSSQVMASFQNDKNTNLIQNVLNDMVMNDVEIMNGRHDKTYLREVPTTTNTTMSNKDASTYFLVTDPRQQSLFHSYYNQVPVFDLAESFEIISMNFYQYRFPEIVNEMRRQFYDSPENHPHVRAVLLQSPYTLQEMLVENIVLMMVSTSIENAFFDFILNHYMTQSRLEKTPTKYVSTILPDKIRELIFNTPPPFVWKDVQINDVGQTLSEESNEFIRKYITENPYKYYGIIEISGDKTTFKIRDVRNQDLVFGTNKAKIPKGEVCAGSFSRKKSGLLEILLTIGWEPDEKMVVNMPSIESIRTTLSSKEKARLLKDANLPPLEEITDNEMLMKIYLLGNQKIPDLCQLVRKRFEELDLIYEKRVYSS